MTNPRNADIKTYIAQNFAKEDQDLLYAKENSVKNQLPNIEVSANTGKLLFLLAQLHQPKKILEIGTLGGYSTLWLAKGAPEAHITTIEGHSGHAAVARENFKHAGLDHRIELLHGNALKMLTKLTEKKEKLHYDLIFLDADKEGYPDYLPLILKLAAPRALLITDNLIPKEGFINQPDEKDEGAKRIYEFNAMLASHPNIESILVPAIVGERGRVDALGISLINFN